jgi:deoxyhypusine synthase
MAALPKTVESAVLMSSEKIEGEKVQGYDFNQGVDFSNLLAAFKTTGFQATNMALAIEEINRMRNWRLSDEPIKEDEDDELKDPKVRAEKKCLIYLAYTSNLISCGVREVIRFLVQHKMVDVLVTSAGGVEEDFVKCLAPTLLGDFHLDGRTLRKQGMNRIGNMLVPNENYCKFEDWLTPILDKMLKEQQADKELVWTPSKMIARLGKEIDNPESVYYWAYKNDIPVFCPAITDGSIGDMLYFHSYKNPGLIIDVVRDIKRINDTAVFAKKTGMIILGGGMVKHHTCNANLMRNGADFSVFINTGQEFDGSDSGARPDEAISWGKIKMTASPVKVYSDATLVFPIVVAETFAKDFHKKEKVQETAL